MKKKKKIQFFVILISSISIFLVSFTLIILVLLKFRNYLHSTLEENHKNGVGLVLHLLEERFSGDYSIQDYEIQKGKESLNKIFPTLEAIKRYFDLEVSFYLDDKCFFTTTRTTQKELAVGRNLPNFISEKLKIEPKIWTEYSLYGIEYFSYFQKIQNENLETIGFLEISMSRENMVPIFLDFSLKLGLVFLVLLIIVGLLLYYYLKRKFQDLEFLEDSLILISEGNLQVDIESKNVNNEFASLYSSLNTVLLNLSGILSSLRYYGNELNSKAEEVKAMSTILETNSANTQNAVYSTNSILKENQNAFIVVGESFHVVFQIIQGINSQLLDLEKLGDETSIKIKELVKSIQESQAKVKIGEDGVNEVIKSMENVKQKTAKITEFTNMITDISDMTNLLALNASIEAARAGEFGRGFAVVASEITKLAQKTIDSVKSVRQLTEETLKTVNEGVSKVYSSSVILKEILSAISSIEEKTSSFHANIMRQIQDIIKISENAKVLNKFSINVKENMDSIHTSSEGINLEMEKLLNSNNTSLEEVEKIKTLAVELENYSSGLVQIVNSFKL